MALKFSTAARNAIVDTFITTIGNGGIIRIYDGTRPANPGTAVTTQTILAEVTLASPIAPSASNGVLTLTMPQSDPSANATGTATWFRIFKSDGTTAVLDGDVGTSGTDMVVNTTSLTAGGPFQINSFTLTAPT